MTDYQHGVLIGFWNAARKLAWTSVDEAGGFRTLVELVNVTEGTLDREGGVPSPTQGQVEDPTLSLDQAEMVEGHTL